MTKQNNLNSFKLVADILFKFNTSLNIIHDQTFSTVIIDNNKNKSSQKRNLKRSDYINAQKTNASNNISFNEIERSIEVTHDFLLTHHINSSERRYTGYYNLFDAISCILLLPDFSINPLNIQQYKAITLDYGSDLLKAAMAAHLLKPRNDHQHITIKQNEPNSVLFENLHENHAHLWASAPVFDLIWIELMNQPNKQEALINNIGLNNELLQNFKYRIKSNEPNRFRNDILIASYIRFYFFAIFTENSELTKRLELMNQNVVRNSFSLHEYSVIKNALQDAMFRFDNCIDYCNKLPEVGLNFHQLLHSEISFLRFCFSHLNSASATFDQIQLFHLYLVVKTRLRSEIIQSNMRTGFSNFYKFQKRKEVLFNRTDVYFDLSTYLALKTDHSVESKEVRISPKSEHSKIRSMINKIDEISFLNYSDLLTKKRIPTKDNNRSIIFPHFYTIHFGKQPNKPWKKHEPRNQETRSVIESQSHAIMKEIISKPNKRRRVFGIDAASSEYDCRPEVFATAYRFLSTHPNYDSKSDTRNAFRTYHVGEDFPDIVDGMRAIDEVLLFLYPTPKTSDRIGHALASGLNVTEWYQSKSRYLRKRKQDHLDDLFFLIKSLRHKRNSPPEILKKLHQEFYELYAEIYPSIIDNNSELFDIYERAYLLRSDCPSLYAKGHFDPNRRKKDAWANSKISACVKLAEYRKQSNVVSIYYKYHYDKNTRNLGDQLFDFYVYPEYIEAAEICQSILLERLRKRRMKIEANPSSNFLIGKLKNYGDHPIFKWIPISKVREHKLSVSINTDDAGIFDTNLKMEYELIQEAALLKKPLEISEKTFKKHVDRWILKIIQNSKDQTFR